MNRVINLSSNEDLLNEETGLRYKEILIGRASTKKNNASKRTASLENLLFEDKTLSKEHAVLKIEYPEDHSDLPNVFIKDDKSQHGVVVQGCLLTNEYVRLEDGENIGLVTSAKKSSTPGKTTASLESCKLVLKVMLHPTSVGVDVVRLGGKKDVPQYSVSPSVHSVFSEESEPEIDSSKQKDGLDPDVEKDEHEGRNAEEQHDDYEKDGEPLCFSDSGSEENFSIMIDTNVEQREDDELESNCDSCDGEFVDDGNGFIFKKTEFDCGEQEEELDDDGGSIIRKRSFDLSDDEDVSYVNGALGSSGIDISHVDETSLSKANEANVHKKRKLHDSSSINHLKVKYLALGALIGSTLAFGGLVAIGKSAGF